MSSQQGLGAYRVLLRAIRIAFKDDARLLNAARTEARQKFEQGRALAPGSQDLAKAIEHAQGVASVLRQNVVQGVNEGQGDQNHYRLRIHTDIEKGDNESIFQGGAKGTDLSGVKCER